MKREVRVLIFPFYLLMQVNAGRGRYPQEKILYTRNPPCPARVGQIQPESVKKHSKSGWGGADRCGFCPALVMSSPMTWPLVPSVKFSFVHVSVS